MSYVEASGNKFIAEQFRPDLFKKLRNHFSRTAEKYKDSTHTSELLQSTWKDYWDTLMTPSANIVVPDSGLSTKQIFDIENEGDVLFYLPKEINLDVLKGVLPGWVNYPRPDNMPPQNFSKIPVDESRSGWRRAESDLLAPNRYLNSKMLNELEEKIVENGRDILDVREYLILSYFSNVVSGQYFDERTMSYLGSALIDGREAHVNGLFFKGTGRPNIFFGNNIPYELGVRSSQAI